MWAKAHAPEDPVNGVVAAGEGVLWPGGWGPSVCRGLPQLVFWCRDGSDPGLGSCGQPVSLDPLGEAEHGQSKVVACPPRDDLGQGTAWG